MERGITMMLSNDARIVLTYLQSVIEDRLKKHTPGLLISLNMYAYSRYGKYATQLFTADPKAFVDLLRTYFRGNEEMVVRMIRYLLKPLNDAGDKGIEAINALIRGDNEEFIKLSVKLLKKEAKKWLKELK